MTDTLKRLDAELEAKDKRVAELEVLLKVSACPNTSCRDGSIPRQVGEQEWEADQCQFCYEKEALLGDSNGS